MPSSGTVRRLSRTSREGWTCMISPIKGSLAPCPCPHDNAVIAGLEAAPDGRVKGDDPVPSCAWIVSALDRAILIWIGLIIVRTWFGVTHPTTLTDTEVGLPPGR